MPRSTVHMCLDIRGALRWGKSQLKGMFTDDTGRALSADEAREHLYDCLAKGWRVIPLTPQPCEGFSYETGCPGHPLLTPADTPEEAAPV